VKSIPRQAVLKPAHAVYKLQNQHFALGDRVIMIRETGGVPLSAKGVVVGLTSQAMEVVWDVAFLSGTTLGNRCSQYRGMAVSFDSCLNLTDPQYVMSTQPTSSKASHRPAFKPQFGPRPAVQSINARPVNAHGGESSSRGFMPHILSNPQKTSNHDTNESYGNIVQGSSKERPRVGPENGAQVEHLRETLNYGRGRSRANVNGMVSGSNRSDGVSRGAASRRGIMREVVPQPLPESLGQGMIAHGRGHRVQPGRGLRGRGRGRGFLEVQQT